MDFSYVSIWLLEDRGEKSKMTISQWFEICMVILSYMVSFLFFSCLILLFACSDVLVLVSS